MAETVHRFLSAQLGNERTIWIRAPRDPSMPFHLAIFLDAELYRDRVGAVSAIEELEDSAGIANSLFVFVSMESAEARWEECACHRPFAAFINEELVPWLVALYPSIAKSRERVLIGLSYTGLAAAFTSLSSTNRFTRVVAQSGSFWWNDCWLVEKFRKAENELRADFYLDVGLDETAENVRHKEDVLQVVSQIDAVRKFRDVLRHRGRSVEYIEFSGGHDFAAWRKTLPHALGWALPISAPVKSSPPSPKR